MTNILEAIVNIVNTPVTSLRSFYSSRISVNNVGEALESYVKDAFANTILESDEQAKIKRYSLVYSWLGNQNHPPDIMIKNGDAIEVKKQQSANSDLALNSSYPKATLLKSSELITAECRTCEDWNIKDMIYCVGHTDDNALISLWMVYGSVYAARHEIYQLIKQKIADGINEIPNVELAPTKELGRVNRVDPLGITNLRIRGMWQIQNPRKVFDYLYKTDGRSREVVALIPTIKYYSFPQISIRAIESKVSSNLKIRDVQVKDPNNPANLIDCKLVVFKL